MVYQHEKDEDAVSSSQSNKKSVKSVFHLISCENYAGNEISNQPKYSNYKLKTFKYQVVFAFQH